MIYVGEHGSKFADMTKNADVFDKQYRIFAGKFRRYHGESWFKRIFDVKTNLLNLRDALYTVIGCVQSFFLVRRVSPDVILLKGGYVGLPIGLAAAIWHKPFVTHDSDAVPGLSNRLVSRWATWHATGTPVENYTYPKDKTTFVGVLVSQHYQPVTSSLMQKYRKELSLPKNAQLLLVTGGSSGARAINDAMQQVAPRLLSGLPDLHIVHIVGRGNEQVYGDYANPRLQVFPLVSDLYRYSGAADVIVTRAGANTLAEFGVQGKACIVIPSPWLAGGHQLKNTQALTAQDAVVEIDEQSLVTDDAEQLQRAIELLLAQPERRHKLGARLQDLTPADATQKLAELLLKTADRSGE